MQEINTQNTLNELKYIIYNNPVCEEVVLKSGFKNISRYVGKRNSFIFE